MDNTLNGSFTPIQMLISYNRCNRRLMDDFDDDSALHRTKHTMLYHSNFVHSLTERNSN